MTNVDDRPSDNTVFLRGRLGAAPEIRTLPSGDEVCTFRLTVDRPDGAAGGSVARVDSIDCAAFTPRARRTLARAAIGDVLEVTGALRRRFWRSPAGLGSRYEVVIDSARVLRRRRNVA